MDKIMQNAHQQAAQYTAHNLLRCYCREIASPLGLISYPKQSYCAEFSGLWGEDAGLRFGNVVALDMPFLDVRFLAMVDKSSKTQNFRFLTGLLLIDNGAVELLAADRVPALVLKELCLRYGQNEQPEFLAQVLDSRDMLELIISHQQSSLPSPDFGVTGYLASEQSLLFGHSFHPAPKSREGLCAEERLQYSPEFAANFQLHYFAVSPECLRVFATKPAVYRQLAEELRGDICRVLPPDWSLIPCHPWQAQFLLKMPAVAKALQEKKLIHIGARGLVFSPTASVRTLFNETFPYFIKASLSLRITNSVRKNAYYELESAVAISSLLEPIAKQLQAQYGGFSVMLEPVAATVDLPDLPDKERKDIQSHFGVILRNKSRLAESSKSVVLLAGTLFSDGLARQSNCSALIQQFRQHQPHLTAIDATQSWFDGYVTQLLPPVLNAFMRYGIAFEPHLQNVLVETQDGAVVGVVLRDLEGTKLDRTRWPSATLPPISDRARSAMCHEQHEAWRRVVYCLFVNNFCQAVAHVSGKLVPETVLWAVVRRELRCYMKSDTSDLCQQLVSSLLTAETLPSKANLITRFMQQADSRADYVEVLNPLRDASVEEPVVARSKGLVSL